MKKRIAIIASIGVALLLISILLNVLGVRKVNYYKEQERMWIEQRMELIEIADSLKRENVLLDDAIEDKQKEFEKLEDEKTALINNIDTLSHDDVIRELTEYYCGGDGDNTKGGVCPSPKGE